MLKYILIALVLAALGFTAFLALSTPSVEQTEVVKEIQPVDKD